MRSLLGTIASVIVTASVGLTAPAQANAPHVHGKAQMRIVVEGKRVVVALEIPQDNLVGFERAPKGDAELEKAKAALAGLQDGARWLVLNASAMCTTKSVKIVAPRLQAEAKVTPTKGHSEHADVEASYEFECAQVERLESLTVNMFDTYKSIKAMQVQIVGSKRQKTLNISSAKRVVAF